MKNEKHNQCLYHVVIAKALIYRC